MDVLEIRKVCLALGMDLPPAEQKRWTAYLVEMSLTGTFEFADAEPDEETVARLVAVNGLSILYTTAREHVWLETSRGRWGALGLPSVSFAGMDVAITNKVDPPRQVRKKPKPRPSRQS